MLVFSSCPFTVHAITKWWGRLLHTGPWSHKLFDRVHLMTDTSLEFGDLPLVSSILEENVYVTFKGNHSGTTCKSNVSEYSRPWLHSRISWPAFRFPRTRIRRSQPPGLVTTLGLERTYTRGQFPKSYIASGWWMEVIQATTVLCWRPFHFRAYPELKRKIAQLLQGWKRQPRGNSYSGTHIFTSKACPRVTQDHIVDELHTEHTPRAT